MRGSTGIVICYGKKAYTTYYSATKSAKNLNRYQQGTHAAAYHCPICHEYHIGNSLNHKRRKRSDDGEGE